jgi:hypothetical protein
MNSGMKLMISLITSVLAVETAVTESKSFDMGNLRDSTDRVTLNANTIDRGFSDRK